MTDVRTDFVFGVRAEFVFGVRADFVLGVRADFVVVCVYVLGLVCCVWRA